MSNKTINKESYNYYKKAYRANKRYRDKINDNNYGGMLSEKEFIESKNSGMTTSEIVYNQFHFYAKDTAKKIQESIKREGFKVSIKNIQNRNFSTEVYDAIKKTYKDLQDTLSSREAALLISYTYFGS